jgi:hypothetical protein
MRVRELVSYVVGRARAYIRGRSRAIGSIATRRRVVDLPRLRPVVGSSAVPNGAGSADRCAPTPAPHPTPQGAGPCSVSNATWGGRSVTALQHNRGWMWRSGHGGAPGGPAPTTLQPGPVPLAPACPEAAGFWGTDRLARPTGEFLRFENEITQTMMFMTNSQREESLK